MITRKGVLAALVVFCLKAVPAQAVVLDESSFGDFPPATIPLILPLDTGTNSLIGTSSLLDFDEVIVQISGAQQITGITLTATSATSFGQIDAFETAAEIWTAAPTLDDFGDFIAESPAIDLTGVLPATVSIDPFAFPVGAGSYIVYAYAFISGDEDNRFSYQIDIEVAEAVPEPAGGALMLGGLSVLALMRRRARRD